MHFEWNIYTFASNWNHGGIFCDVHFAGHLRRIEQSSEAIRITYEIYRAARAGGGGVCEDWNWEPLS